MIPYERILAGFKNVMLIEDRVGRLEAAQKTLAEAFSATVTDHERRLTRIETIIEIARPDGAILRIASPRTPPDDA